MLVGVQGETEQQEMTKQTNKKVLARVYLVVKSV